MLPRRVRCLLPSAFLPSFPGGEGGIRTHGTVSRTQHFQCCQFSHSCTSPWNSGQYAVGSWQQGSAARCLLSTVYCLLPTILVEYWVVRSGQLAAVFCRSLSTVYCLLSTAHCQLFLWNSGQYAVGSWQQGSAARCLLSTVYCLLSTANYSCGGEG